MSKYAPLRDFLQQSKVGNVRLDFAEVESIHGFSLPGSAYRHPAWWSNNPEGHSHCLAWVAEGWQSEQVDIIGRKVTFRRDGARDVRKASGPAAPLELFGALKGSVRFAPAFDPTEPTDEVWEAQEGRR
jgi:hypothetical protein